MEEKEIKTLQKIDCWQQWTGTTNNKTTEACLVSLCTMTWLIIITSFAVKESKSKPYVYHEVHTSHLCTQEKKITRSFSNRVTNTDRRKKKSINREVEPISPKMKRKNVHTHAHISQF